MASVTTQSELLERQNRAITALEAHQQTLHWFIHSDSVTRIPTENGSIPSLAGLVEEIRLRAGLRTVSYTAWVPNLNRYETGAEEMAVIVTERELYVYPGLAGSYFRLLDAPSGAPLTFGLTINDREFTITFESDSTVGAVSGPTEGFVIPAGSLIELKMNDLGLGARGYAHTLVLGVEIPDTP